MDTKRRIKHLRINKRLTYDQIAEKVGVSKAYVGHVLNKFGIFGYLVIEELEDPKTFENKTDEEVARVLRVPVIKVAKARKELHISKRSKVRVYDRRRTLCRIVFGRGYGPGKNFAEFVENLAKEELLARQYQLIKEFYIEGKTQSIARNINTDSDRIYRTVARRNLKDIIEYNFTVPELIEKGVICERKSSIKSSGDKSKSPMGSGRSNSKPS